MTQKLNLDLETIGGAVLTGFPKTIETTHVDPSKVTKGVPLAACEEITEHHDMSTALDFARDLIRSGKAWLNCVELRIVNRKIVNRKKLHSDDFVTTSDVLDVHLNYEIEWSGESSLRHTKRLYSAIKGGLSLNV